MFMQLPQILQVELILIIKAYAVTDAGFSRDASKLEPSDAWDIASSPIGRGHVQSGGNCRRGMDY